MAALPSVPPVSSNSPRSSNVSAAAATLEGKAPKLSRIYRRPGAGTSPTASTPAAWSTNNEKASPIAEHEGSSHKEQQIAPRSPAARRSNKWSALRREILPNPALMTVSEKVQHIIEYV
ncbi:unnamed protein product [Phytophthora fragariaefolia]|uniref:Unnamed protein product n=1 Tax=Phytophthora fragariaefolia TaxID=1490495 RepID=A0A9W6XBV0_9STRA|nr:unnamed protein product [Phytophthora fragariaefolia]